MSDDIEHGARFESDVAANRPETLGLGGPRGPRTGVPETPVPRTDDGPEARFLFRFTRKCGWVLPSGFGSERLLLPLPAGEHGAAGGVEVTGPFDAVARLAVCTPGTDREHVEGLLRHWARATWWTLTIADGLHPVRPFPGHWRDRTCVRCGRGVSASVVAMPYVRTRRWHDHRCPCGWHQLLEREPAGDG